MPTGRVRRTAKVGGLVGGQAARAYATKAANLTRSHDDRRAAADRAQLHDGRDVAVKVQYPGAARAVRADIQNLGLLLRAAKRIAPGIEPRAVGDEIRERLTEELDYEHEAQAQRTFARTWRDHPFAFVPDVVTRLCREHVLVTEWVEGIGFEEV